MADINSQFYSHLIRPADWILDFSKKFEKIIDHFPVTEKMAQGFLDLRMRAQGRWGEIHVIAAQIALFGKFDIYGKSVPKDCPTLVEQYNETLKSLPQEMTKTRPQIPKNK
jgi:hypothetical protein